jgi:hypothetical protein
MSLVQGKLSGLVGKTSGYVESFVLSPALLSLHLL